MARQGQTLIIKPQYAQNELAALPFDTSVSAATPLYEGDLVTFVAATYGVRSVTSGGLGGGSAAQLVTDIGNFLGLSGTSAPTAYWNNKMPDSALVYKFGVANLYQTNGDTYHALDEVTVGADAQTITLASNYAPAAPVCALNATAASALNGLAAKQHSVALAWVTPFGTEVLGAAYAGANALTSGGNPSIQVTVPAFPAWGPVACAIYVDGLLAEVVDAAGNYVISGYSASFKLAPTSNGLAIGRIAPNEPVPAAIYQNAANPFVSGITGSAGKFIKVMFGAKLPNLGIR